MKKIFTLVLQRLLPLVIFLLAQARAWAVDTTTAPTLDKTSNIFSQPWIWIGITAIIAIKLLGPLSEKDTNFIVVRKKPRRKNIV